MEGVHMGEKTLRLDIISMIILKLLSGKEAYAYEIMQEMDQTFNGLLTIQRGTIYPALYRMEEEGLITGQKRLTGKRMERVYYHIEPKGYEELEKLSKKCLELTETLQFFLKQDQGFTSDMRNVK